MNDQFLWVEKYRPQKIEDCILPEDIKKTFQDFVDTGEIPNMLLSGPAGCGKTTVAKALCNELGVDFYVINGSDEGRFLDTIRNTTKNFASTVSLRSSSKHKVIIIDEADNTTNDVQLLLRAFTEEFSRNCRFIFTCNFKNRIIEPLHSRCACIDFTSIARNRQKVAASFLQRLGTILEAESIEYDQKVVIELVKKHYPDWRRVLNECQRYSVGGKIDSGILASFSDVSIDGLMSSLQNKNFKEVRVWTTNNMDNDPSAILRKVFDAASERMTGPSFAEAVLILAKYQYQIAFVADQEINLLAALTEIMATCEFK